MSTPTPTPLPEFEAAKLVLALAPGFFPGLGREGARLLLAQSWGIETGRGAAVKNHNVGNLMARGFRDGKEYELPTSQYWKGEFFRPAWFSDPTSPTHVKMLRGEAPSAFRAYASFVDGMSDYLALISHKPELRAGLLDGRAYEFAKGIWDSGYCRDANCAPTQLTRTLKSIAAEFADKGYFNSLPSTVKSGMGLMLPLAVLGVTGFIFWGTVRKRKS